MYTVQLASYKCIFLFIQNTKTTHVIPSTVATAWYYVHNDLCQKTVVRE